MTLANTSTVNSYVGTGAVSVYPFSFVAFQAADISVLVTSPTGTLYTLTMGTDYTISGLNPAGAPPTTGNVTLVNSSQAWLTSGFLTTGWSITISRVVAIVQSTSIRNQGDFYQETVETTLDYLTMICQQLQQQITDLGGSSGGGGGGGGDTAGDITITIPGDGLILTTPDGTKTARIALGNDLAVTVQQLT